MGYFLTKIYPLGPFKKCIILWHYLESIWSVTPAQFYFKMNYYNSFKFKFCRWQLIRYRWVKTKSRIWNLKWSADFLFVVLVFFLSLWLSYSLYLSLWNPHQSQSRHCCMFQSSEHTTRLFFSAIIWLSSFISGSTAKRHLSLSLSHTHTHSPYLPLSTPSLAHT